MENYKKELIDFMIECEVLKFGDFVTKSGRKTPFFVNTGFYRTGSQLSRLGKYYAKAIRGAFGDDFDVLFGPAYKGIPLSVATSIPAFGLKKFAVPTLTIVAPASKNSMASSAVAIPPIPITGTLTAFAT